MSLDDLDAKPSLVTVPALLEILGDKDREALMRALTDRTGLNFRWSAQKLSARLLEEGFDVPHWRISSWRTAHVPR
jgi:hypothetical protein